MNSQIRASSRHHFQKCCTMTPTTITVVIQAVCALNFESRSALRLAAGVRCVRTRALEQQRSNLLIEADRAHKHPIQG